MIRQQVVSKTRVGDVKKWRTISFDNSWPFWYSGASILTMAGLFYFLVTEEMMSNRVWVILLVAGAFGVLMLLGRLTVRVVPRRREVLWQVGFLVPLISYRRVPFRNVKSCIVRYRKPYNALAAANPWVAPKKGVWEVVLRQRMDPVQQEVELTRWDDVSQPVVTTYAESKRKQAEACAKKIQSIVTN
ncbi:MAG: hypothetical protein JXK07_14890 [Spirochaetes bacterium]|nr:hypothetical protein [Spirochaetota bacterium]MBN2769942.1 hypothetical protein [Spirochaetota bacterium]